MSPEKLTEFRAVAVWGHSQDTVGTLRSTQAKGPRDTPWIGHTPSTAGTFWKEFRKNSGKTPETLSERFLEFPIESMAGSPKPYDSRQLFQLQSISRILSPPVLLGRRLFFQKWFREGLSEPVMEFPAVLGVFLSGTLPRTPPFLGGTLGLGDTPWDSRAREPPDNVAVRQFRNSRGVLLNFRFAGLLPFHGVNGEWRRRSESQSSILRAIGAHLLPTLGDSRVIDIQA